MMSEAENISEEQLEAMKRKIKSEQDRKKESEIENIEKEASEPSFWDTPNAAQLKMRRLATLKEEVEEWRNLESRCGTLHELLEISIEEDEDSRTYITVDANRMYNIIDSPEYSGHEMRLSSNSSEFSIFSFTFGSYGKGP